MKVSVLASLRADDHSSQPRARRNDRQILHLEQDKTVLREALTSPLKFFYLRHLRAIGVVAEFIWEAAAVNF
jgi:hypothetical protein